jgi:hypothetical protein
MRVQRNKQILFELEGGKQAAGHQTYQTTPGGLQ